MAKRRLEGGPRRTASLVVQKHLGADSLQRWLIRSGYRCERVGSKAGFRLFAVSRDPETPNTP